MNPFHVSSRCAAALPLVFFVVAGCVEASPPLDAARHDPAADGGGPVDGGGVDVTLAPDAGVTSAGGCAPQGTYVTVSITPDATNAASCRAPSPSSTEVGADGVPVRNLCDDGCACDITGVAASAGTSCTATLRYGCSTPLNDFEMVYDGDELTLTMTGAFVEGERCRFVIVARRT